MIYTLELTSLAEKQLREWRKSRQLKTLNKIITLFEELRLHPTTGTGQVEQLKGDYSGLWSRRIDKSSGMIYSIHDHTVTVTVISLKGHYGDK